MAKRYTTCGTCGGMCYYPSKNFENAGIKIHSMAFSDLRQELSYALDRIVYLEQVLDSRTADELLAIISFEDIQRWYNIKLRGYDLVKWSDIFNKGGE